MAFPISFHFSDTVSAVATYFTFPTRPAAPLPVSRTERSYWEGGSVFIVCLLPAPRGAIGIGLSTAGKQLPGAKHDIGCQIGGRDRGSG